MNSLLPASSDIYFNKYHNEYRKHCKSFVDKYLKPYAEEFEKNGVKKNELLSLSKKAYELGIFSPHELRYFIIIIYF